MTRLIDADALLEDLSIHLIRSGSVLFSNDVLTLITNAPTAQREGWVSVPIEPTKEMIQAACLNQAVNSFKTYEEWAESHSNGIVEKIVGLEIATYKAMISAAPKE